MEALDTQGGGPSTVAYFCAVFKKSYGMTPFQYKKQRGQFPVQQ